MATWTLVIMLMASTNGAGIATVPGFTTSAACQQEAQQVPRGQGFASSMRTRAFCVEVR